MDLHQVKLSTRKEIAGQMRAKLAGDAQLASVGIREETGEKEKDPFAEHAEPPLAERLDDFARRSGTGTPRKSTGGKTSEAG